MNNRQQLSVLLLKKNNILTDHTKNHKGGSFDLQKGLRKMERFLPKDILTLPKHRYTGIQSTPLEDELDENDQPLPGHEPFNQVDELALQHDICYRDSKSKSDKHDCDQVMLKDLKKIKPRNFRERVDRKIVQGVIGTKYKLGLGIKQKQIVNDLFYKNTWKPSQRSKRKY